MTKVFADTFYWVALTNRDDQWHEQVTAFSKTLSSAKIFTTDEVFVELLAYFGTFGPQWRANAAAVVRRAHNNPQMVVFPQTRNTFMQGLVLYEARPDKGYSLTDCISMNHMRSERIQDVLTHDEHFTQEGFRALFRE